MCRKTRLGDGGRGAWNGQKVVCSEYSSNSRVLGVQILKSPMAAAVFGFLEVTMVKRMI
jgi:hypothetical protein